MLKETKEKAIEKGVDAAINLAIDGIKSVFTGNKKHKEMISNREKYEKQLEKDVNEARKELDSLYEMKKRKPEVDLSKDISAAKEFYEHKKQIYNDHIEETKKLNEKEGSDPDRISRDKAVAGALGGAMLGAVIMLKTGGKNLK